MFLVSTILGISSLLTFLFPDIILNFTNYENKIILLHVWNIFSFTLFLSIVININIALIICNIITIFYHVKLLFESKINKRFVILSFVVNLITFLEQIFIVTNRN